MTLIGDINSSLDECRKDLVTVADNLKWALEPGLTQQGRGLDEPKGRALRTIELEPGELIHDPDPDRIPGPRWALDIGDPKLRGAFLDGVRKLCVAELRLVLAVDAVDAGQTPPVLPTPMATFHQVDLCQLSMERRITTLERSITTAARADQKTVAHHVHGAEGRTPSARKALDLAVRKLDTAFARGDVDVLWTQAPDKNIVPVQHRCIICGWRKKNRRYSPRCRTCGTWLSRHGEERPRHLDGISPIEAAQKRRDRGEGWGVA